MHIQTEKTDRFREWLGAMIVIAIVTTFALVANAQATPPADVGDSVQFVIANWQTFGWLGGLAAILNVAVIIFRKIPQGAAL